MEKSVGGVGEVAGDKGRVDDLRYGLTHGWTSLPSIDTIPCRLCILAVKLLKAWCLAQFN